MSVKIRALAPLLTFGAAAAVLAAPVASAADEPHLVCTYASEGNSQCETPGNAQLTASPPPVQYPSMYPFLYGNVVVLHHNGPVGHTR
jgi:hypothetical protein